MEQFHRTEIELDPESQFVQFELPWKRQLLHRLLWLDDDPTLALDVHFLFQFLRDAASISENNAADAFVDRSEGVTVILVRGGEDEAEQSAFEVARHRHFEPVKPAFRASREFCEAPHRAVMVHILHETDGEIGRVRHLHGVRFFPSGSHEYEKKFRGHHARAVHRADQCPVRTLERVFEVFEYRFLRDAAARVLVRSEGERIHVFNFQWSTLGI